MDLPKLDANRNNVITEYRVVEVLREVNAILSNGVSDLDLETAGVWLSEISSFFISSRENRDGELYQQYLELINTIQLNALLRKEDSDDIIKQARESSARMQGVTSSLQGVLNRLKLKIEHNKEF